MKHYGDITKLNGHELPVVDIITGGSPCQDLSVAGKREGLSGQRSGLFMEQIRIIKEMHNECRKAGVDIRPRFMVWENVPGAFSSNKGEDFRAVLEETAKIADETAVIPRLAEKQKWSKSGAVMGDGWSIAWRVHDAQFWGVPQRRKRIALVADFRGGTAPEILFERKSVPGDFEPSREEGQGTATDVKRSINPSSYTLKIRGGREIDSSGKKAGKGALVQTELSATLGVSQDQTLITTKEHAVAYTTQASGDRNNPSQSYQKEKTYTVPSNPMSDRGQAVVYGIDQQGGKGGAAYIEQHTFSDVAACLNAQDGRGGVHSQKMNDPEGNFVVYDWHRCDTRMTELGETCTTMNASWGTGGNNVPMVMEKTEQYAVGIGNGQLHDAMTPNIEKAKALNCLDDPAKVVLQGIDGDVAGTLDANYYKGCGQRQGAERTVVYGPGAICNSVVRRLTPMECERLQGFPDHWTDIGDWIDSKGKKHRGEADSPRYKALGNSIALPFWQWMAERMCKYLDNPTMGSLFDGIGGFPLVYSRCGCKPIWASEIEEFPIAVTKLRFGEEVE